MFTNVGIITSFPNINIFISNRSGLSFGLSYLLASENVIIRGRKTIFRLLFIKRWGLNKLTLRNNSVLMEIPVGCLHKCVRTPTIH